MPWGDMQILPYMIKIFGTVAFHSSNHTIQYMNLLLLALSVLIFGKKFKSGITWGRELGRVLSRGQINSSCVRQLSQHEAVGHRDPG